MSNYIIVNGELYHHGVKGMKWGVRKAQKYTTKARNARESAKEWDEIRDYQVSRLRAKGKNAKADKRDAQYRQQISRDMADAKKYENKANRMAEKRYSKAGIAAGKAAYYKDKANEAYKKHDNDAKVFDKAAKNYDAKGQVFKAEAARKAAQALRARGANIQDRHLAVADHYIKKSGKLNEKASSFASATSINLGKKKIDSILNASKKKGYAGEKAADGNAREAELREKLGDAGYAYYNKMRGKS